MTKKKHIMAAVAVGAFLAVTGLVAAPVVGAARAEAGGSDADVVSARIGAAFASIPDVEAPRALRSAAVRVAKGDLLARPGCAGVTWPNVEADCLARSDGSAAPRARLITIGYEAAAATTTLVRIPAAIASR